MYKSSLKDFLKNDPLKIHDTIVDSFHGTAPSTAIDAWKEEIKILQDELKPWINEDAYVFFEYDIPRLGKRIDVVLLLRGIVFCLEFKVGQKDAIEYIQKVIEESKSKGQKSICFVTGVPGAGKTLVGLDIAVK